MANQLLRNQLKLKFTNQIVTFVRKNDEYYASEILFTNKEELMNILISFTKNKNKIVRWKAYWTLRFLNDSENFVTLLNFFSTQLDLEKDELVKEIIAVSLNNLTLECKKYQQDGNDCLKKYKTFLTKAREYISNKFIYNVEPFHMKDFGYVKTCLIKTKEHFNEIIQAIRHPSESIRIRAIRLLGDLGDKRAIEHLEPLLEDTHYKSFQFDIYYSLYRLDSQKSEWFKKLIDLDKNTALTNNQKEIINNIIREEKIQNLVGKPLTKNIKDSKQRIHSDKMLKIGILTAFELESQALIDIFDLKENPKGFMSFWENELPRSNTNEGCFKIIHLLGRKGKDMRNYVNEIMNRDIDYLFLIGIAGGLMSNGIMIGDILICSDIVDYDYISEGKKSKYKPKHVNVNDRWLQHLRNFVLINKNTWNWENKNEILLSNEQPELLDKVNISTDLPRKVKIGKYFCGSKVIKTKAKVEQYLKPCVIEDEWKEFVGVEMESYSVIDFGEWLDPSLPVAIIKGVSDLPEHDEAEDIWDNFHIIAAYSAAYFLREFLRDGGLSPHSFIKKSTKDNKELIGVFDKKKFVEIAKNLLIRYLEKIITDYEEEEKKFNLIDRTIEVGQAKSEEEGQEKKQVSWKFDDENALSWLEEQIRENRHILIKGEMGIGKTVLMLAIAHKLAIEAKKCIENNQFSELVFPVLIPLKKRGFYSKYKKETQLKGNRFAWLSQIISFDFDDIEEEEKKQFNEYLKAIIKEKPASFTLLFDAFDEFAYKQWEGKLSPRNFFGLKTSDEKWEGAVIITSRPSLLNDLQKALLQINLLGDGTFSYARLPRFTDPEIKRFLLKRPLFIKNKQYSTNWLLFKEEIIDPIWNKHYGTDWRIPLFLWALSQIESKEMMPKSRMDLFLYIFKYAFNWYYCKKDRYKLELSQEEREEYCKRKDLRTIIIDPQNEDTSTYKVIPIYFHRWELKVFKQLALFLSKENKYQFSKQELTDTINELGSIFREITIEDPDCYYNLLLETMNDGSFIISISTDDEGKLVYSISPWRMQEAFTATKFIELSKTERIDLLKKLFLQIEDMRETIILCWQMLKDETKDEKQLKNIFISACPDFEFLFKIKGITPIKLLTRIHKIIIINGERRIVGIDLRNLDLENIDVLQHLEQLKTLSLNGNGKIKNLAPLAKLTQLRYLYLSENQLADLAPLTALTKLQILDLRENQLIDLAPLATLTQLQILDLGWNLITDLAPLAELTKLQELYLKGTQLTELAPLATLTKLQILDLKGTQLTELAPLAELIQLQELDLERNQITDLAPLAKLTLLQELDLGWNLITDLAPLAKLTQLQRLDLWGNEITDLAPLAELTQLRYLYLSENQLTDLAPLAELIQLQELDLKRNQIIELAPLAELTQLQRLDLRVNQITDLTPLAELTQLQELDLERNQLTELDVSPFIFHKDLRFFWIDGEVQLFCKRELIDKITCPALIRDKDRIKPND